jgi:DNA repair protein RadD
MASGVDSASITALFFIAETLPQDRAMNIIDRAAIFGAKGQRKYQKAAIAEMERAVRDGAKSILLVSPTGSGKTKIVSDFLSRNSRHPVGVAHRIEIVRQIGSAFERAGLQSFNAVSFASSQAIHLAASASVDAIFIDEAHHIAASRYQKIMKAAAGKLIIGATATPYRADGVSVIGNFDCVVNAATATELCEQGYLAKLSYVSASDVDFTGVKLNVRRDLDEKGALERVRVVVQAGDIVQAWRQHAFGRSAIIYAINVEHVEMISRELREHNIPHEAITGRTKKSVRDQAIRAFENGYVKALVNCEVFTEGTDVAEVGAIIMVRPTLSRALYKQMIGRGMRPDCDCVVIDHVGNYKRHGDVMAEDVEEVAKNMSRLTSADERGETAVVPDQKTAIHVEKIDVSLSNIWVPNFFKGVAA